MNEPAHGWSDDRLDQVLGNLLRWGVMLSAAVVLLGGVLYLIQNGVHEPRYHNFRSEPAYLRSLSGIVKDALACDSRGIIQLGILLLIGTPISRVVFSVFAFAVRRDRTYVVVTLIVLAVLVCGLLGLGSRE